MPVIEPDASHPVPRIATGVNRLAVPAQARPSRPDRSARPPAFGVVLCARPGLGAVTLALLFGLFNLIAGIWMLVQGTELRRTGKTRHSVRPGTPQTKAA